MRLLSVLAVLALLSLPAARAGDTLTVGFDNASVPTMYADDRGEAAGVYPAIVRRAFAKAGLPVRLVVRPFRRVLLELQQGTMAGGSVVQTPQRADVALFSAPYFNEQVGVYTRSGSGFAFGSLEDLHGKTVGVIRGWAYGAAFDQARAAGEFAVEEVDSDTMNLRKLALGRIDVALVTTVSGELLRGQPEFSGIALAPRPLATVLIRLALNKNADRPDLLRRFDAAIAQMRASGELASITAMEVARATRRQRQRTPE